MKTTSASANALASDGAGSKVWELVPSGTIPVRSIVVPPMFWAMFVIGETVVTTLSRPSSGEVPTSGEHAVATTSAADTAARTDLRIAPPGLPDPLASASFCKSLH